MPLQSGDLRSRSHWIIGFGSGKQQCMLVQDINSPRRYKTSTIWTNEWSLKDDGFLGSRIWNLRIPTRRVAWQTVCLMLRYWIHIYFRLDLITQVVHTVGTSAHLDAFQGVQNHNGKSAYGMGKKFTHAATCRHFCFSLKRGCSKLCVQECLGQRQIVPVRCQSSQVFDFFLSGWKHADQTMQKSLRIGRCFF